MTTSRDQILGRLRQANAAPLPLPDIPTDASVFADHPQGTPSELARIFAERLRALHGIVHIVPDELAAAACLQEILAPDEHVLLETTPWVERVVARASSLANRLTRLDAPMPPVEMAEYHASITGADWLIARTGSIVHASDKGRGRLLSVLPPLHIVIARTDQVVMSLQQAYEGLAATSRDWRVASLISGPSRTADIEKILVLGAHGPKRLQVVLVDQKS